MTNHEGRGGHDDEFLDIVNDIDLGAEYNERDGYLAIDLSRDLRTLREAFDEHVKAHYDLMPGIDIPDDYYDIIEYNMNRTDSSALEHLGRGDVISSTSEVRAFTMRTGEKAPIEFINISEEDSLVGTYYRILIPILPKGPIEDYGVKVESRAYEPALVIVKPAIEDASGELHYIGEQDIAMVPFMDNDVRFVKRIYPEEVR